MLWTIVEPVARQLQLRKDVNLRQTNNIIASTTGKDLTSKHCAVRCLRKSDCSAFNFGVTSDGTRICEEIADDQHLSASVLTANNWSYYSGQTNFVVAVKRTVTPKIQVKTNTDKYLDVLKHLYEL